MNSIRQFICVLCLMAANTVHPQSALPAAGEAEFRRLTSAVSESIRTVEKSLAPLSREVQEVQQKVDRNSAALAQCRQQVAVQEARVEFVSDRLGTTEAARVITIGNESYSQAEFSRAVDEMHGRLIRTERQCEQTEVVFRSNRAELSARKADHGRLAAKLEAFKQAEAELASRWAEAGKRSQIRKVESALSANDSLILASDSELGRALFRLEALVSSKEAEFAGSSRIRNIDLTQSDFE